MPQPEVFTSSHPRIFVIHDNYERDTTVICMLPKVIVLKNIYEKEASDIWGLKAQKVSHTFSGVKKVFVGKDITEGIHFYGHTVMLDLGKNTYVHIQRDMEKIKLPEPVIKYKSIMGNNNSPYCTMMTKSYFIGVGVYIKNKYVFGIIHRKHPAAKYAIKAFNKPVGSNNNDPHRYLFDETYRYMNKLNSTVLKPSKTKGMITDTVGLYKFL